MTPQSIVDRDRADESAPTTDRVRFFSWLMGGVSVALGGAVLAGWHTHTVALIQVHQSFVPMQYNTALGFILCGAGILLLTSGMATAASAVASLAAAVGVLTLIEYLFQTQLGLDQLFLQHYITVNTPYPGRMAPTTAASFALVGSGLIVLSWSKRASPGPLAARVIAAVVVTQAVITLVAYAAELRLPFAGIEAHFTFMAVHTATGFLFLGTGLYLLARPGHARPGSDQPGWLPYVVGAVGLILSIVAWQQMSLRQDARIRQVIATEINSLRSVIDGQVASRINALLRLSERWESAGGTPRDEWEVDAARYVEHPSTAVAFTWVDKSLQPRWSVRADATTEVELEDILRRSFMDDSRSALNDARDRGQSTIVAEVVDLGPEDVLLNFYMPLFPGGEFDGFLLGSYQLEEFVEQLYVLMGTRDLEFVLFEGGRELFGRSDDERTHDEAWGQEALLSLQHVSWRLRTWPSLDHLSALTTRSPEWVASGVVFIALLVSFLVGYAQTARHREVVAESLSLRLERDIVSRIQTEKALQESEFRFKTVAESALDAMIFSNANGTITYWNKAATSTFGFAADQAIGQPLTLLIPEEFRDAHRRGLERIVREGGPDNPGMRVAVTGLKRDGTRIPIELSLVSWDSADGLVLAGVARDMSETMRTETTLQLLNDQLAGKISELTHFNQLAVGRELRMIELKREINQVLDESGKPAAYDVSFSPEAGDATEAS